ncbi:MAG: bifunctional hydroxymethylpyrimidine kinase/phosphomethylpyrimidine kinase [Sporomusaceae bacterium]|nr:bifunctional hydroxymethylpyrimidine kinase/phosphomethylpyrimidine kinase [Sporomusaceae bacterium]
MATALTIAGSDSSGGAGIQADIKTFSALGVFGMSAITALTAQNTLGVSDIREMDTEIIRAQISAVFEDIAVGAVKIGMLSSSAITRAVAASLRQYRAKAVVVDPVMIAKSGSRLLQPEAIAALKTELFPLADVVTPNLFEAGEIVGFAVNDLKGMEAAARAVHALGARHVVIKGGHLEGAACDVLFDGTTFVYLENERINTPHTHGTGCTFSSAIAAGLAKGMSVEAAVRQAKEYITGAIRHGFPLGRGVGPTHHFFALYEKAGN